MNNEQLNKLKEIAANYMDGLSEIRGADFNAGQAYAIRMMFGWIEGLRRAAEDE